MTYYMQGPALWVLIAGTSIAALIVIHARNVSRRLRRECAGLEQQKARAEERNAELEKRNAELEDKFSASVDEARKKAEEAINTVLKSAMRTLQGLAGEQQLIISRVQEKYGESPVLQDLLEIDHMNSQFGRRAQSIAVLCGGWAGRQREVASVHDVVRSAQGRIRHYQRVEILSQVDFGVTSRAVEPVALALAELLDNATSYSQPETMVGIDVRTVPKGICIVVDDAGVGMDEEEKVRAARLLSSERASGVSELGDPPRFGFALIGQLCERYGFTVSVDSTSPYGGVRAVVLLPDALLTSMPEPKEATRAVSTVPSNNPGGEAVAALPETADGLPRRRRKQALAIVPQDSRGTGSRPRSAERTASTYGRLQRGTQSGRAVSADTEGRQSSTREPSSEGHDVR
ncbi:sensor histidine kinase [Streptomyces sodiiphilus]|uniref:histidine kinase n=1 Tax=Streptomyces sodiiphilus TaxID=226217 RepID=A0ABN2PMV1_9ACTN